MAGIETSITLTDGVTPVLNKINKRLGGLLNISKVLERGFVSLETAIKEIPASLNAVVESGKKANEELAKQTIINDRVANSATRRAVVEIRADNQVEQIREQNAVNDLKRTDAISKIQEDADKRKILNNDKIANSATRRAAIELAADNKLDIAEDNRMANAMKHEVNLGILEDKRAAKALEHEERLGTLQDNREANAQRNEVKLATLEDKRLVKAAELEVKLGQTEDNRAANARKNEIKLGQLEDNRAANAQKNEQKVQREVAKTVRERLKNVAALFGIKKAEESVATQQQKTLRVAQQIDTEKRRGILTSAREALVQKKIEGQIIRNKQAQDRYNASLSKSASTANHVWAALKRGTTAYLGTQAGLGILNTADQLTMSTARLDLMNDGLQTTAELQEMIYKSAMRSRAGYLDMAESVSKIAIQAGSLFTSGGKKNNAAIVQFMENYNKMGVISGASAKQMSAAMLQITQALSSGELRGDELRSVTENMPLVSQYIAESLTNMGDEFFNKLPKNLKYIAKDGKVAADEILELGHNGLISGQILRDAVLGATNDLNEKIKKMPYTWGQVWTMFKNFALKSFQPVLNGISAILKNEKFQNFAKVVGNVMALIADKSLIAFNSVGNAIGWVYDKFVSVVNWVKSNWTMVSEVLVTIVSGFLWLKSTIVEVGSTAYNYLLSVFDNLAISHGDMTRMFREHWWHVEKVLNTIKDGFVAIGNWFKDNSGWIISSILGIAAVLGIVALVQGAITVATWVVAAAQAAWTAIIVAWTAVKTAACAVMSFYTGLTLAEAAALTWMAACEWAANLPLIAKIILIGLIIAAIVFLVAKILEWCGVSENTAAAVCGIFAWVVAVIWDAVVTIWNALKGIWNALLSYFDGVYNFIIGVVEWVLNVMNGGFNSFGDAVANLLGNIIAWFLDLGTVVTRIIDAIFGTNWSDGLKSLRDKVVSWGKNEKAITLERDFLQKNYGVEDSHTELVNPNDWYKSTYGAVDGLGDTLSGLKDTVVDKVGQGKDHLGDKLKELGDKFKNGVKSKEGAASGVVDKVKNVLGKLDDTNDLQKAVTNGFDNNGSSVKNPALDKIEKNTADTAKNTSKDEEDFSYLRELADRDSINRYTLADFKVDMTNHNTISNGVDGESLFLKLAKEIYERASSGFSGTQRMDTP